MQAGRLWKDAAFWIAVVCLGFLAAEIAHDRFNQTDFGAYYEAAHRFLEGRSLYFITEGHARVHFLYPPATALCFAPFTLLDFEVAKLAWYLLNSALIVGVWRLLCSHEERLSGLLTLLFFLAIGFTLERELHVGNINLVALFLCLSVVSASTGARPRTAGLALAGAVLAKPQNALIAIPLVRRHPRVVFYGFTLLIVCAIIPLPFYGADGTWNLYRSFLASSSAFAEGSVRSFKFASTTAGLWEHVVGLFGLDLSAHVSSVVLGFVAFFVVVVLAYRRYEGGTEGLYVTMAMIPLTVPADYQVFMFVGPLVYHLLWCASRESRHAAWKAALVTALILYGGNWHDIWGDRLSDLFLGMGVHGIGSWALVCLALTGPGARRD